MLGAERSLLECAAAETASLSPQMRRPLLKAATWDDRKQAVFGENVYFSQPPSPIHLSAATGGIRVDEPRPLRAVVACAYARNRLSEIPLQTARRCY